MSQCKENSTSSENETACDRDLTLLTERELAELRDVIGAGEPRVTVAALYVQTNGCYYGLPHVDPWDIARDARLYAGPHPVVAHPPCSRWCQLAHVVEARYGHRVGDDGGCFAAALAAVRTYGGVLEHPSESIAWRTFALIRPTRHGWTQDLTDGSWSCEVSQCAYGHRARKLTWLYYVGDVAPPSMDWRRPPPKAWCSYMSNHGDALEVTGRVSDLRHDAGVTSGGRNRLPRLSKREASATPIAFRDVLIAIAESARK